jgi:hypothetical protein
MNTPKIMSMDEAADLLGWTVTDGEPPARHEVDRHCVYAYAGINDPNMEEWDWCYLVEQHDVERARLREWLTGGSYDDHQPLAWAFR